MADLIDRDMTIYELEAFRESCIANLLRMSFDDITDVVKDIPAVNRWIPCSEMLPEKSGEYLVYTEYEDVFKCYFEKENDPEEDECQWGFYQDYRDPDTLGWAGTTWTAVETVTHWMPLPEPPEKE